MNAVVAISAATLAFGTGGLVHSVVATAAPETGVDRVNPDLLDRCGTDVVVLIDRTLSEGAGAIATAAATGAAKSANPISFVTYGLDAEIIARPDGTRTPAPVTDADLAETAPLRSLLTGLDGTDTEPTAEPAGKARDWAGALRAASEVLDSRTNPADPALVLHVTAGPGTDTAAAIAAADDLRARPATHLLVLGADGAADLDHELVTIAGPDIVRPGETDGIRPGQHDIVILAPSSADTSADAETLRIVAAQVEATIAGLCDIELHVHADDPSDMTPRVGVDLTLRTDNGAAEPLVATTDDTGTASWRIAPSDETTNVVVTDPEPAEHGRSLLCTTPGGPSTVSDALSSPGGFTVTGIARGATVNCELRTREAPVSASLQLAHAVLAGDVDCPDAGPAAIVVPAGATVTHCLSVSNNGQVPLDTVMVLSEDLGLAGAEAWRPGALAQNQRAAHRVVTTIDQATDFSSSATATMAGDTGTSTSAAASAAVDTPPAAIAVQRLVGAATGSNATAEGCADAAPGDDAPALPPGTDVTWCLVVTNIGGTYLADIDVVDAAISATSTIVAGVLAPGASTTLDGSGQLLTELVTEPLASAAPSDAAGVVSEGTVAITSAPGSGLTVSQNVNESVVSIHEDVTFTMTVTNTADTPLTDVSVEQSECGELDAPSQRLADDGDATLDRGEAWVYVCSTEIVEDTAAVTVVEASQAGLFVTQDARDDVLTDKPDMRVTKKLRGTLVAGGEAHYELKIGNTGTADAPNVVVVDTLPAGLTAVRATIDSGSCTTTGNEVRCALGTVPFQLLNEWTYANIYVRVDAGTTGQIISNTASVSTTIEEWDLVDNNGTAVTRVLEGALTPTPTTTPTTRSTTSTTEESLDGSGQSGGGGPAGTPGFNPPKLPNAGLVRTGAESSQTFAWALVSLASGVMLLGTGRRRSMLALALG